MVIETRLNRPGVDAIANNIIRSARATAKFFPQIAPERLDLFSQILSIRNEGRHEVGYIFRETAHDALAVSRVDTADRISRVI